MLTYIAEFEDIGKVEEEMMILVAHLPSMSREKLNILADIVHVLAEIRRVALQFGADCAVTMS